MYKPKSVNTFILKAYESVPDLYLILSPTFYILTASNAYLATTYTERKNIVGQYLFDVFPDNPENTDANGVQSLKNALNKLIATGTSQCLVQQRYDVPKPKSLGGGFEKKYWNAVNIAVFDDEGALHYIIHKITASTETKNTEQKIFELTTREQSALINADWERKKLRNIFSQAPVAIAIFSGKENIVELMNDKMASILRIDRQNSIGEPVCDLPKANTAWLKPTLLQVFRTGILTKLQEIEIVQEQDNPKKYFNANFKPLLGVHNEILGVIIIVNDISTQVHARQSAENSERQLRLVTDGLPVLIGYLDLEERYRFANKAYEQWFPYKAADILGKYIWEVTGRKAYNTVKNYINKAKNGEQVHFEAKMQYNKDCTKFIHASYVPDVKNGKTMGFFTLVSDITEEVLSRKKLIESEKEAQALANKLAVVNEELRAASEELVTRNEELRSSNIQLSHSNADMDNFIYTASHDLKAPISNIEGLMHAMLKGLSEESRNSEHFLKISDLISKSIERFKRTLADLSEITKLQRTEGHYDEAHIHLADIITEVHLDLASEIDASNTIIHLRLNECGLIKFSKKNARSIVYNLLSNAIKYRSPDRTPEVIVHCQTTRDFVVLSVKDNGLGMKIAEKDKIFAMFKRLHDHVEGTGIGLYIVKKIIETTGGKIEVDSEQGKGSSFRVFFKI